ncbi:MAG: hypothetical protein ACRC3G_01530 [Bacteroidales bacterium]
MKKAKYGQGGCLSTSWWGIAGQARNDECYLRVAFHSSSSLLPPSYRTCPLPPPTYHLRLTPYHPPTWGKGQKNAAKEA